MSSVGGFRKGEIDGKSFLIFTLLPQPDDPSGASSSSEATTVSGADNDLQSLFICPRLRMKADSLRLKEYGYESDASNPPACIPVEISPHFPTKRSGDQQVQYLLDSAGNNDLGSDTDNHNKVVKICKLPIVPLFWCNNQESAYSQYECRICRTSDDRDTNYYFCVTCERKYHKECVESPCEIKYPSYLFLSFHFSFFIRPDLECVCCKAPISFISYHCPTSGFGLHPVCAMKPIPNVIDHLKSHPHPLTFFPKQDSLACHVCGMIKETIPTYVCVSCVFVVHQDCVYSPTVIKISRHHHRISFASSVPSGEWSCGVCRKEVDNRYGAYSCNKCDIDGYFVHTRCALRRDLWDGKELEGIPEEAEIVVPPFKWIADGIIHHFSHDHLLKLEISRVYDEDKFCSACGLPVYEGNYYLCMDQCDFILHEACANAPCKKYHPLHAHPLTLKVITNQSEESRSYFRCDACRYESNGFVYEGDQGDWIFRLDMRCAMVSEPFEYQGHEHPLFLALSLEEEKSADCQICRNDYNPVRKLNCIECDFVLCFTCATLPYQARYKHDRHLLTFHKEKEVSDESGWCELCEKKIVYSRKGGFYSCDDYCSTTIHVNCLLGKEPYMRHGSTMILNGEMTHIVRNNTMSRPLCYGKACGEDRCLYGVFWKKGIKTFCTSNCALRD